jgi:hypothetical protein
VAFVSITLALAGIALLALVLARLGRVQATLARVEVLAREAQLPAVTAEDERETLKPSTSRPKDDTPAPRARRPSRERPSDITPAPRALRPTVLADITEPDDEERTIVLPKPPASIQELRETTPRRSNT